MKPGVRQGQDLDGQLNIPKCLFSFLLLPLRHTCIKHEKKFAMGHCHSTFYMGFCRICRAVAVSGLTLLVLGLVEFQGPSGEQAVKVLILP